MQKGKSTKVHCMSVWDCVYVSAKKCVCIYIQIDIDMIDISGFLCNCCLCRSKLCLLPGLSVSFGRMCSGKPCAMQKHGATWRVRYGIGELKVDGKVVPPEKNPSPVFIWGGTKDRVQRWRKIHPKHAQQSEISSQDLTVILLMVEIRLTTWDILKNTVI